ncbi:MAG: amidohydrolase, partial [Cyclobacteriaceae bacterium]
MHLIEKIKSLSESLQPEVIQWRRHLHANPELSYDEFNTAKFVAEKLKSFGLEPVPMATTGLVALIQGKPGKNTIALRADMDALPIEEKNNVAYKSTKPGVMHACG